ncbi:hypothetical protein PENTCL1PPCAC_27555, partial [Pristionchus entomophagus]
CQTEEYEWILETIGKTTQNDLALFNSNLLEFCGHSVREQVNIAEGERSLGIRICQCHRPSILFAI